MKPMTKTEFSQLRCQCGVPGCESPLIINCSKCHTDQLQSSVYDGILTIQCLHCNHVVCTILLGD